MKVEPSELAIIEMIAKAIKRYRLDEKREMVMLGMQQMLKITLTSKREKSLALEEFGYIQPGDNRQSRSADSGHCVGSWLPEACCGYTLLGCVPMNFVNCGTASTE